MPWDPDEVRPRYFLFHAVVLMAVGVFGTIVAALSKEAALGALGTVAAVAGAVLFRFAPQLAERERNARPVSRRAAYRWLAVAFWALITLIAIAFIQT